MGQDLAKKSAPTFKKAWDCERRKLKEGDLLTLLPDEPRFVLLAEINEQARVEVGEPVHIRGQNDRLWVDRELIPIGAVLDPPPELLQRAAAGPWMLSGVVHAVHSEAGLFEIMIT